ncbi:MAG TPA: substrate-binding domain-containing protein [Streptosporangiaceae bacterium]|jgi:D-xylose transport system substrate-binding protein|nr:substrate-binding domain-containing protein [Streptosporangiaceae bacterium]
MLKLKKYLLAVGVASVIGLAACSSGGSSAGGASAGGSGGAKGGSYTIGLLLPETDVARYETKDKPYFEEKLKDLCSSCKFLYDNANSSASTQQEQAESMLAQGANVLVVDPYDGVAAASIVSAAKAKNVPVVAYDRLISSPDLTYVISNDYQKVGQLQAQALVGALKARHVPASAGGIIMINGATTDNNAGNIKAGALSVIKASGYQVLSETDTWDPTQAQQWVGGQATVHGHKIIGLYSANDGNAAGAIAALKAKGWTNGQIGALGITGLDATVQGIQYILSGLQLMTTYNAFKSEAYAAATVAYDLAKGTKPPSGATVAGHPASLNPPQSVTATTIGSTVIKDGFWTASAICTSTYQAACQKDGIS